MNNINAILRFTFVSPIRREGRSALKPAITAAVAIIAIAVALTGGIPQAHADSPTVSASQSPDASQALRRYTLALLHTLSNPDANQYQRYRQATTHCADIPPLFDKIGDDVSPLDHALSALSEDLCADLDQRLNDARTIGLLLNEPEAMRGYVLIPGRFNNDIHLIDHLGRVIHSWQLGNQVMHAKLLDNGNLLAEVDSDERRSLWEVDSNGNAVWQYTAPVPDQVHHDFFKMAGGNVLALAIGIKTREEATAMGANPDKFPSEAMMYDYLVEVRPTGTEGGEIVWEWSAWDYIVQDFDPSKPNYGDPSEHPELIDINFLIETPRINSTNGNWNWLWTNAMDYNPALDQIMLSPRSHSEMWIIDHSPTTEEIPTRSGDNGNTPPPPRTDVLNNERNGNTSKGGTLLYRWGNPRAYGHGTASDQQLFWQHHTQWIAHGLPGAGNILVFNNGHEIIPEQRRGYSSIDEFVPSLDGYGYRRDPGAPYPPDTPIWTYTAETPTDFYSRVMGGVQRLPNGNTLITEATSGNLFQVTPDGKQVWKYVYPMNAATPLNQGDQPTPTDFARDVLNNAVYRAYWYASDHPGLQNYDLMPGDTIERYE